MLTGRAVDVGQGTRRLRRQAAADSVLQPGHDLLTEPLELLDVVRDRPEEHPLYALHHAVECLPTH